MQNIIQDNDVHLIIRTTAISTIKYKKDELLIIQLDNGTFYNLNYNQPWIDYIIGGWPNGNSSVDISYLQGREVFNMEKNINSNTIDHSNENNSNKNDSNSNTNKNNK